MPAFALERVVFTIVLVLAFALAAPAVAATTNPPLPEHLTRDDSEPAPAPTPGERVARVAVKAVGVSYRWGGESPETGFDCSGLVRWAYGRIGVDLPHNSYALYSVGRSVPRARMEPGDVLFFEGLGHVGLYLGRGRMVHAPQTGREVEIVRLGATNYGSRLIGARRMAGD